MDLDHNFGTFRLDRMQYPIVRRALCDAQKGLFLAKGVDMMSSSSPVAAATLLSSTWDVFHNLTDSAHEMTLPCSKERHEASDAISPSAKTRFQICKAVADVTVVGRRGLILRLDEDDLPETRRRRPRGSRSRRSRRRRSPAPVPGRESHLRGRWGEAATPLRCPPRRTFP